MLTSSTTTLQSSSYKRLYKAALIGMIRTKYIFQNQRMIKKKRMDKRS